MLTNKRPGEPLAPDASKQPRLVHPDLPKAGHSSASGNSAATQSAGNHPQIPEDTAVDSGPQLQPKVEQVSDFLSEAPVLAQPQLLGHELPPLLFQQDLPQHVTEAMVAASAALQLIAPPHQLPQLVDHADSHQDQHHLSALPQASALNMEAPGIAQIDGFTYDLSHPGASSMLPSLIAASLQQPTNIGSELPDEGQPEGSYQDAASDPADRPFKCPEPGCGFASKRKSNLTVHSRIHSRPRPPRRCRHPGCEFVACEGCNLKEHQRMHAGEKPYRCTQEGCDASFARVDHLTVHMRTHTGEKPYLCSHPGCAFAAAQQSNLHRHMQSHSAEKPYRCTEPGCNAAFSQSSNLVRHQRAHRGEKRFHCEHPGCNFAAAQLANVKRHMQCHTGERPYHCDWPNCSSAFSQLANLVRHKRIHTAEKPFKCNQEGCSYSAAQRSNLQRHMQTAHGQMAPPDPGQPIVLAAEHAAVAAAQIEQAATMLQQQPGLGQSGQVMPAVNVTEMPGSRASAVPAEQNMQHELPPMQHPRAPPVAQQPAAAAESSVRTQGLGQSELCV